MRGLLMNNLTIIVPAYNEVDGIEDTINELSTICELHNYQVIIVDDGSNDGTWEKIKNSNKVRVIRNNKNLGYGASLKKGIAQAETSLICITDADGTYPNDKIPYLFDQLIKNDLDMIIGARTGRHVKIPFVRKPAKWAIGKLANWVTNQSIPDINSGLRIFKKSSFFPFQNIVPDGFSFTTTITLGMLSGGYKVEFIPIDYFRRSGKSKIKPIRDTMNFIKLILRIGLYFAPLKIFIPISIMLFLLAVGWGVFTKYVFGDLADVSSLIIAMTGFQVTVLAFIAELINHRMPNQYRK